MTGREAYIALNMMEKVGPVKVRSLVNLLGYPEAIFEADFDLLVQADGIGKELAKSIMAQRSEIDVRAEEKKVKKLGAHIITPLDDEYPDNLREIHDPPLALYVWGTLETEDKHAVAVVGTRRATHYGLSSADRLSYQLGKVGFTVISGMARGIDTAAHKGAVKGGGRTIAVLGSALDELYPAESEELARTISKHGAVISEFRLGTKPGRTTFPMRNRIVSGMSMGVLVVEASTKSGSMITADEALEQGRSVFAVPGRIDVASARGTNRLIKEGARLVDDVNDMPQEFEMLIPAEPKQRSLDLTPKPSLSLSDEEKAVVVALEAGTTDVDSLGRRAELASARLSALLIGLEMKRVIRMLPGRLVELNVDSAVSERS